MAFRCDGEQVRVWFVGMMARMFKVGVCWYDGEQGRGCCVGVTASKFKVGVFRVIARKFEDAVVM